MNLDPAQLTKLTDTALKSLAPRPKSIADTGLSEIFLGDLMCKHLRVAGILDIEALSSRLALPGAVVEKVLSFLRGEGQVEVHGAAMTGGGLRFALTDRGRATAAEARERSGYIGPAPVPLKLYEQVATAQSIKSAGITRESMRASFADVIVPEEVLDQLGPALHSGRAIFVYGHPGTGKTYICRRLSRMLAGSVLIPHAIAISETIVQVFDPSIHEPVDRGDKSTSLFFEGSHDERFVSCYRPVVTVGGELTMDLLDVQYDSATGLYQAPLQLRANNGIFILDDLGRQQATPTEVLNRWIVPMEERRDHLNIEGRQHFSVPFDLVLVFSTNLNPLDLADEAFLRRIGYKIKFDPMKEDAYRDLWHQVCAEHSMICPEVSLDYLIERLHKRAGVQLLPCHPRDLAGLALDHFRYEGKAGYENNTAELSPEALEWAWQNYFINLNDSQ